MQSYFVWGIIVVGVITGGCSADKLFDIKSDKTISTPTTLEDCQLLLDDAAAFNLYSPRVTEVAADYHSIPENVAPQLVGRDRNAYTWSRELPYVDVSDWSGSGGQGFGAYYRIYLSNLILEVLDKVERSINPTLYDNVKGQALYQRGRTFFDLSQMFVPPYGSDMRDLRLGIPLRVKTDITLPSSRSTIEETYQQVFKDLSTAVDLLPDKPLYKTRASKGAALAMLARYFIAKEDYTNAGRYADLALKINSQLLNYNDLTIEGPINPFPAYFNEIIFYCQSSDPQIGFIFQNVHINNEFYNSYNDSDLRKNAFFWKDTTTGTITYKGTYSGFGFDVYFGGLAVDELYLIRAECNARSGNVHAAMEALDALLKTRWDGTYVPLEAANAEEALVLILQERKKELVYRGTRWSDLRRLNKDPRFAQTFQRTLDGKTYTLEPNSYKYTFPIPDDIIEVSGMQQNPGW